MLSSYRRSVFSCDFMFGFAHGSNKLIIDDDDDENKIY